MTFPAAVFLTAFFLFPGAAKGDFTNAAEVKILEKASLRAELNPVLKGFSQHLAFKEGEGLYLKEGMFPDDFSFNHGYGDGANSGVKYYDAPDGRRLVEYGNDGRQSARDGFSGQGQIRLLADIDQQTGQVHKIYGTGKHYNPPFAVVHIEDADDLKIAQEKGANDFVLDPEQKETRANLRAKLLTEIDAERDYLQTRFDERNAAYDNMVEKKNAWRLNPALTADLEAAQEDLAEKRLSYEDGLKQMEVEREKAARNEKEKRRKKVTKAAKEAEKALNKARREVDEKQKELDKAKTKDKPAKQEALDAARNTFNDAEKKFNDAKSGYFEETGAEFEEETKQSSGGAAKEEKVMSNKEKKKLKKLEKAKKPKEPKGGDGKNNPGGSSAAGGDVCASGGRKKRSPGGGKSRCAFESQANLVKNLLDPPQEKAKGSATGVLDKANTLGGSVAVINGAIQGQSKGGLMQSVKRVFFALDGLANIVGAASMIFFLITMFLPGGQSAELTYMKSKFAEVNNALDVLASGMDSLQASNDWLGAALPLLDAEVAINEGHRKLKMMEEALSAAAESGELDKTTKRNLEELIAYVGPSGADIQKHLRFINKAASGTLGGLDGKSLFTLYEDKYEHDCSKLLPFGAYVHGQIRVAQELIFFYEVNQGLVEDGGIALAGSYARELHAASTAIKKQFANCVKTADIYSK